MNIKCKFGFHKYGKWNIINQHEFGVETLNKQCNVCGKVKIYNGLIEIDIITDEHSPYIFKN